MKHLQLIAFSSLLIILMFIFQSCEKDLPTVETKSVVESDITTTTAIVRGNVTDNGGDVVTERGICYGTAINPTVEEEASEGGNGNFEVTLSGLTPDTEYFVRAYAVNGAGTSYGENEDFRTKIIITPPEVQTESVEEITSTSAVVQGNVLSDGGAEVTARGICYGASPEPTEKMPDDEAGEGIFEVTLTDLEIETDYYARAYATNSAGTSYGDDIPFKTLGNEPDAKFAVSKTTPVVGESVQFTDQSTNSPNKWNWDFGDGQSSTLQNPTHAYNSDGTFTVTLTVENDYGSDTEERADLIIPGYAPVAEFAVSNTKPLVGDAIIFTDLSVHDPEAWSWDFGDGQTSSSSNPSHMYTSAGSYTVKLTVSNEYGSHTETKTNLVIAGLPPVASFDVSDDIPTISSSIQFTDQSTNNPTSWEWDFGDGQTSTLQNPSHSYSNTGYYNVRLTASNDYGEDIIEEQDLIAVQLVDIDGNHYQIVKIEDQIWMKENLKVTRLIDYSFLDYISEIDDWANSYPLIEYCWPNMDPNNKDIYGALYAWPVVNSGQLCPAGWHVPTIDEWAQLVNNLGGVDEAGGRMKETGLTYWAEPNEGATNESQFSARPAGAIRQYLYPPYEKDITFNGHNADFWSSTISDLPPYPWFFTLNYSTASAGLAAYDSPASGLSVRCIKNQ